VSSKRATKNDVESGRAVFYIPDDRSDPYDLGYSLPVRARVNRDIGLEEGEKPVLAGTIVEIIQCEIVDSKEILVGFRHDSEEGVCMLEEVTILPVQPVQNV
jgi:hypothetical protein